MKPLAAVIVSVAVLLVRRSCSAGTEQQFHALTRPVMPPMTKATAASATRVASTDCTE